MKFEELANELLLDLFKVFDTIHIFRAFRGLNSRFNSLLFKLFQAYCLDFRSATKHDFDILCDEYLPQIGDQTITLRLSDDDDTLQEIELFLGRDNLLHHFTRRKAFCLYHVFSEKHMERISSELKHLPVLTHLSMIQCYLPCDQMNFRDFTDGIWNLPKLIYCNLEKYLQIEEYFVAPTVISSSKDDAPSAHLNVPHLCHLTVEHCIQNCFWSILPRLDQLSTLDISLSNADTSDKDLMIENVLVLFYFYKIIHFDYIVRPYITKNQFYFLL